MIQQVLDYATEHNINKFDDQSASEAAPELKTILQEFLDTYNGDFPFLLDMQKQQKDKGRLSLSQARGVLNCMLSEARKAKPAPKEEDDDVLLTFETVPQLPLPITKAEQLPAIPQLRAVSKIQTLSASRPPEIPATPTPHVPDGIYTIIESGKHLTLRIQPKVEWGSGGHFPPGTQVVSYLRGPDNTMDYEGFAFLMPNTRPKIWSRFTGNERLQRALDALLHYDDEQRGMSGLAYALLSNRCCRCGKVLTVPASIYNGMGPICAAK